ncbi:hypothetical protein WA026_012382 [Henosepilachna vigintioctopunctata]|uniref:G-protein coupled receptors family 1 profile domain-containing protein n=1 Tax=Henosepilachna vigintioctopunctata TaxID=420089 RepID=A0AAW1UYN9_9CUCU
MNMPVDIPLFQMSFGFFFVVPLCIIMIQYVKMSSSIFRSEHPLNGLGGSINTNRIRSRAQSNKSIVRMLLSVVVGFFCCWAPFHAQRLMVIYASHWEYIKQFNYWMFWATGILYYFSSTLNPILYNLMSRKMRNAFKRTFGPLFGKQVNMRNSDLSSTTIQGRISRSFREENQLINSGNRHSIKKVSCSP